jgi:nucleotide-binding universal stress UspA family protein
MKILVGLDGSNTSEAALQLAIKTAKAYNADLLAITSMATGTADKNDEIRSAEKELEETKAQVLKAGVSCSTHLLIRGKTVGEDIVAFAAENAIDLIVVGVKRRSRVGKILMGSNAQYVIIKAGCPVLTVK